MLAAKPLILCVDQEAGYEMLDAMLNASSPIYEFVVVNSAAKALEKIEKERFDLYILECILPEVSGVELCRHIRETDAATPVLFYTVMAQAVDRFRGMAAGANEFLVKPNDIDLVPKTIERLLDSSSPAINMQLS